MDTRAENPVPQASDATGHRSRTAADAPRGADPRAATPSASRAATPGSVPGGEDGLAQLPPYARSLLKVEVPVSVTLAATTQSLQRILELSPGTIIQFNKPCDEPLALEVGGQTVARGEAVKIGDKFGLWITSIALPGERFWVIGKRAVNLRAK